jgi:N-acetylmuramoyl-L-alanine amidase
MRARPIGRGKPIELGLDRVEIVNPGHDGGSPPFPDRQIEATIAPERVRARAGARSWRRLSLGETVAGPASAIGPSPRRPLDRARAAILRAAVRPRGGGPPGAGAPGAAGALRLWRGDHRRPRPPHETVVAAFQRHFRSERVDDEADASTGATLKALIEGLEYE